MQEVVKAAGVPEEHGQHGLTFFVNWVACERSGRRTVVLIDKVMGLRLSGALCSRASL